MTPKTFPPFPSLQSACGAVRRFSGPVADEIYLLCPPLPQTPDDIAWQVRSSYGLLQDLLASEGGSLRDVVQETVFFRDIAADKTAFRVARHRFLEGVSESAGYRPASTFVGQPPLDPRLRLVLAAVAVLPRAGSPVPASGSGGRSGCACEPCAEAPVRMVRLGSQEAMYAGNIHGLPGSAVEESYSMLRAAEHLLEWQGMSFKNVVRTWIYLRHMDRDYAAFNQARRRFFLERGLNLRPASTGINGAPLPGGSNVSMSFYALQSREGISMELMRTPTLNEAWTYGSDFSRGMRAIEANKIALYVSGTASIDEQGRTVHVGDLDGQARRMILNIAALLEAQRASCRDILSAVTYLKRPGDARRICKILRESGLEDFPNALVEASVCRPDLLCEMEVLAALPIPENAA